MIKRRYHGMNLLDGFRFMFSKKPYYIVFHPTARCNCKCGFCFNWEGVKNAKEEDELNLGEINEISKNLGYAKYLTISGGEPFLRDDIAEICIMFYKNSKTKSVAIHTNCSFPEKVEAAVIKILKSCPSLRLTICPSIDALYGEHDKLRGYKGLFKKVEKTIVSLKRLQQNHKKLYVSPVGVFSKTIANNMRELSNFLMWRYGLLQSRVIPRGDITKNIKPSFTNYVTYRKQTAYTWKWLGNREKLILAYENFLNTLSVITKKNFITPTLNARRKCSAGVKTVTILPNGNVAACEPFLNKKRFFMGNLRDFNYNLGELLKSDTAQKVKDYAQSGKCSCTWECIIPINLIFDRRQTFFVIKSYITTLKGVGFRCIKLLEESLQRRIYLFYQRNKALKLIKVCAQILRTSLKSDVSHINFKKERERCEILLINPSHYGWLTSTFRSYNEEPLGIMSIATYLNEKDFKVKIIDVMAESLPLKEVVWQVKQIQPAIVGISAITRRANEAYIIGNAIKKIQPNTKIVYGGVHPSFFPEEPFEKGCADFVVIGEGEKTMEELCSALLKHNKRLARIKGIAYKDAETLKINKPRALIKRLDSIPFPNHVFLKGMYYTNIHVPPWNKERAFSIMASRGCPYNCEYCSIPKVWNRKLRHRSPRHVIREIKNAIRLYDVRVFHFYDDDFLINHQFVKEWCNILIKEKLSVAWLCQSRTNSIVQNKRLMPLLKKSGCKVIELGIESCDERVMQNMNKMQTANDIKEAISIIRQEGIEILPLMMSFYPGETLNSAYKTSEIMLNLGLWLDNSIECYTRKDSLAECNSAPFVHGFFTTPLPGSELYKNASKKGVVLAKKLDDCVFNRVNFLPNSFLEDVPVKSLNLSKKEFFQNATRYNNAITYYLARRSHLTGSFKSPKDYFKFLYSLYEICEGKLTVDSVCKRFSDECSVDKVCVALRFLALFGFIRSKS
jgi:radical SAM protein with 4Fe4S-binding SPASM domain